MRWLDTLFRRNDPGAIPTVDFYFLAALGDLVRPAGTRDRTRPIERIGPFSFVAGQHGLVIRYVTPVELAELARRQVRQLYYVVDDVLPVAADCTELPADYRARLGRFVAEVLPGLLALDPTVVAPRREILDLFPGRHTELLDPCWLTLAADLRHFDRLDAGGPLEVAFLGTRSHQAGLGFLADVLGRVVESVPGFRLTLFQGRSLPHELRPFADHIDNRNPLPWPAYRKLMERSRFHVVLAPLPDTPFNAGRSITKLLDVATVGAAGLYSDRAPFSGRVTPGVDGQLLTDDAEAWAATILQLAGATGSARALAKGGMGLARKLGDPQRVRSFWLERLGLAPGAP